MVLVPPLKKPNTDTFHLTAWSLWFKGLFSQLIAPSCAQFLYRQKDKRDGDKHTPLLWIRGTVLFLFPRHQPVETWASVLQLSTYQLAFTWKAFKIYTSTQTHAHTRGKIFLILMTVTEILKKKKWALSYASCCNRGSLYLLLCTLDRGNRLCRSSFHQSFMYLKANVISPFRRFFFRINYSRLFNFSQPIFPSSPGWIVCSW